MPFPSYETIDDLKDVTFDVKTTAEILSVAPSAEVTIAILNRVLQLSEDQLSTALHSAPSSLRGWRTGKQHPSAKAEERLRSLGAIAAYLLQFETFTTPAAVGRWLAMPRMSRDGSGRFITALEQAADNKYDEIANDAVALLSGSFRRRSAEGEAPTGSAGHLVSREEQIPSLSR